MSRRLSRESAMKLLYQLEIQKSDREEQIELYLNEQENLDLSDKKYIQNVLDGVKINLEQIDELIKKYLKGWSIERVSKVDLSILRLSIYEMLFREDIPCNVSINEAVELTKKYSSEQSKAFVNGVLGSIEKEEKLT